MYKGEDCYAGTHGFQAMSSLIHHQLSLEFTFEAFNERSLVWRALCCTELENPGTYRVNVYEIHKDFRIMRKSEWKQFKGC